MVTNKNLPDWLHSFIYKDLAGFYQPDRTAARDNLNSGENENQRYLGTYFPRSFAEAYCIFSNLFENNAYIEAMKGRDNFSILTFGCGTGGDLMGLLEALAEKIPWIKNLDIVAYDGNFNAVEMLKTIVEHPANKERFNIRIDYAPVPMQKPEDFGMYCSVINRPFDIIMSFKMVNELYRHDIIPSKPYANFFEALASKLTETGVMLLLDVPLKEKGVWLSLVLSRGLRQYLSAHTDYEALVPIPCHVKSRLCTERCYLEKVFTGDIFSSEKVIYSMIARTDFAKAVCLGICRGNYVVNASGEHCKKINGTLDRDAYDLKIK